MISIRSITRIALAAGALALAFPAAAGTLSPQLRALAASYQKAPQATVSRAAQTTTKHAPGIFRPHVSAAGMVQVYIHYRPGGLPTATALATVNAGSVLVSRALGLVQAWIPIAKLQAAAALDGVTVVGLPVYGMVNEVHGSNPATDTCTAVPTGLAINSQGIAAQRVDPLHQAGITGAGVKVGVISDGADCTSVSQNAGYLPGNVWVDSSLSGSGDEGTAMMEEIHAAAPDATLGFCGPATTADFLQCLDDLRSWGANVISDDLSFFPTAYNLDNFETTTGVNGIVAFSQQNADITLTTSAGNSRGGYFEEDYVTTANPTSPGGPPISLSPTYTAENGGAAGRKNYPSAMDFGTAAGDASDAAEKVTLGAGNTLYADLTWDDPANGPYDDLDLFLLKQDGTVIHASTWDQGAHPPDPNDPAHYPLEFITYKNSSSSNQTLYLVALCYSCSAHGSSPLHVKLYGLMNGGGIFDYVSNGGIIGDHQGLDVEVTTAAANYSGRGVSSTIESYSDAGPYSYGDWVNGAQHRVKPDITGTDGVTVSGAGGFPTPFRGTSAASPNVGAVIALLRSGFPAAEPDAARWKQLIMDKANANALSNYTLDAGGAGLTDAEAAATSLSGSITATITAPTGSPITVNPNTNVQFDATCDYTGTQSLSYKWSFGGNSGIPDSSKLIPDPVQYANGGVYTAMFTCSDPIVSGSAQATVAVQAAATADSQSVSTAYETEATGQLSGSGIGGEQVSYEMVAGPTHGTATVNAVGGFTYTPDNGYSGGDSFTFDIDNGVMTSNTATVSVTVGAAPPPPPPSDGGGGGGVLGGLGLGLLAGLAGLALALRRRR